MEIEPSKSLAERKGADRRRLWIGLALSLGIHWVTLWTPIQGPLPADSIGSRSHSASSAAESGIRVLSLQPVDESPPAFRDPRDEPWAQAAPDEPPAPPETLEAPASVAPPRGLEDAGATSLPIDPSLTDHRLWMRRSAPRVAPSTLEDERALVRGRILELNRARAESSREVQGMSEWTRRAGERGQWGVTPGKLHFGSRTLPLCGGRGVGPAECGFGMNPNRLAEYREWLSTYSEIELQAGRLDLERSWRDRARAIRARREAKRRDP